MRTLQQVAGLKFAYVKPAGWLGEYQGDDELSFTECLPIFCGQSKEFKQALKLPKSAKGPDNGFFIPLPKGVLPPSDKRLLKSIQYVLDTENQAGQPVTRILEHKFSTEVFTFQFQNGILFSSKRKPLFEPYTVAQFLERIGEKPHHVHGNDLIFQFIN